MSVLPDIEILLKKASQITGTPYTPAPKHTPLSRDEDLAVRTIIGEAKGEGEQGWEGVADVIRNRAKGSRKSFADVVLAPGQFEPWSSRRQELESYDPNSPIFQQVARTALPVLRGERRGPAGDATHFYGPKSQAALGRPAPSWDNGKGIDIGNHRFFNLGYSGKGVHGTQPSVDIDDLLKRADAITGSQQSTPAPDFDNLLRRAAEITGTPTVITPTPEMTAEALLPPDVQPVAEHPETIEAQIASAMDMNPKNYRSGVLTTEPSQNAQFANRDDFLPTQTEQGTLWVYKPKARKLKLRTAKDLQLFVDKNPDALTRIMGKVDNVGSNTATGSAVHTFDPATGRELTSSIVTNPESAAKQVEIDKASFPGSESVEMPAEDVVAKRLAENIPDPQEFARISDAPPFEGFTPPNEVGVRATEFPTTSPQIPPKPQTGVPGVKHAPTPRIASQQGSQAVVKKNFTTETADGYQEWLDYTGEKPSAEALKKYKAAVASGGVGSVSTDVELDDSRASEVEQSWSGAKTEKTDDDILKGSEAVRVNLKGIPVTEKTSIGMRQAVSSLATKYGATAQQVEAFLDAHPTPAEGDITKDAGDEIEITFDRNAIAELVGKDVVIKKYREKQQEMALPIYEQTRDAVLKRQSEGYVPQGESPLERSTGDPLMDEARKRVSDDFTSSGTDEDIQSEYEGLKRRALNEQETQKAQELGAVLKMNDQTGGVGSGLTTSVFGRGSEFLAGLYKYSAPGLFMKAVEPLTGKDTTSDSIAKFSNAAKVVGASSKGDGIVYDVGNFVGETSGDVPRLIGATFLSGGNPIVGFGLDEVLRSSGRGETLPEQAKLGVKGAIMGAIFHGASRLGSAAENTVLSRLVPKGTLTQPVAPKADIAFVAKLAGEGTRIGTIGAGTFTTAKLEGASTKDALKQSALMLLTDLAFNNKKYGEFADLSGKVFRLWKDGDYGDFMLLKPTEAQRFAAAKNVTPDANKLEVIEVTGKVKDSDIQAVIGDEQLTNAKNVTPKLKGDTKTVEDRANEFIPKLSPEDLEAKIAEVEGKQVARNLPASRVQVIGEQRLDTLSEIKIEKPKALSSTQVEFSKEQAKPFEDFRSTVIDKNDVADKADLPSYAKDGVNIEPHIILKYGIHANESTPVEDILKGEKPIEVTLGKTGVFPGSDKVPYDVVTVEVQSDDLNRLNKKISDGTEVTDTHKYSPHVTLAYVKKGLGEKYASRTDFEGQKFTFDGVKFSPADKSGKTQIPLAPTTPTPKISPEVKISPELEAVYAKHPTLKAFGYVPRGMKGAAVEKLTPKQKGDVLSMVHKTLERAPQTIKERPSDDFSKRLWLRTQNQPLAELDVEIRVKGGIPNPVDAGMMRNLIVEKFRLMQDYSGLGTGDVRAIEPWQKVQRDVARNYLRDDHPPITESHALQTWRDLDHWYGRVEMEGVAPAVLNLLDHKYWTSAYDPGAIETNSPLSMASRKVEDVFDQGAFKQFKIDGEIYHERILREMGNDVAALQKGDIPKGFDVGQKKPRVYRVDPKHIVSAFSNPTDIDKIEQYSDVMRQTGLSHKFPPIMGFESVITEDDIHDDSFFMDGTPITKDDIGTKIWKVTDGHHRSIAAHEADLPYLEAVIDRATITDPDELKEYDRDVLAKARTPASESLLSSLATRDLEPAHIESMGKPAFTKYGVRLDEQGMEIVRRAKSAAGLGELSVDGMTTKNPGQTKAIVKELTGLSTLLRTDEQNAAAKKVDNLIYAIKVDAGKNQGIFSVYIYDDAGEHEGVHRASHLGVPEDANKDLAFRWGLLRLTKLPKRSDFITAVTRWQELEGRDTPIDQMTDEELGHAAEEVATYLANGDNLGLAELEANTLLVDLAREYGKERIRNNPRLDMDAALDHFRGYFSDKILNEVSNERESKETGRSVSSDTEGGTKPSSPDSGGGEVAEAAESGGREKSLAEPEVAEITGQTETEVVTKNRKFAESIGKTFYDIGDVEYEAQTEKGWMAQSQKDIRELGVDEAIRQYNSLDAKKSQGFKTALGVAIASELYANGTATEFADFGRTLTTDIGNVAQELRASQLLSRLSPEHASLIGQQIVEKAIGRDMTEDEFQKMNDKVQPHAQDLKTISDDKDFSDAVIQDYERRIENFTNAVAEMDALLKSEKERAKRFEQDAEKVKAQFEAYKTKKPRKPIEKLKAEVKENRKAYQVLLQNAFGDKLLMMVAQVAPDSDILAMASSQRDSSPLNNPEILNALINLSAVKLSDELAKGVTDEHPAFTNDAFDAYLDTLSNGQLIQPEKDLIHAKAWEAITTKSSLSDEARASLRNRSAHGRRASVVLNAEAIAEKQAEREAQKEAGKAETARANEALKNKDAFKYDKFARAMVQTAQSLDMKPETVFTAFAMREFGNEQDLRREFSEQFPESTKKDFAVAFMEARRLDGLTKTAIMDARNKAEAGKKSITLDELMREKEYNKRLAIQQRKARQNLEKLFKELSRTKTQKVLHFAEQVYNIPRALGFSSDAGFLFRQGNKAAVMHSGAWGGALKVAFPALTNKAKLDANLHELYDSDIRRLAEARGAKFKNIGEQSFAYEDWANSMFEEGFNTENRGANETRRDYIKRAIKDIPKKGAKEAAKTTVNTLTFIPRRSNMAHGAFLDALTLKIFEEANTKLEDMNKRGKISDASLKEAQEFFAQKYAPVITGRAHGKVTKQINVDNVLDLASRFPMGSARLKFSHFQFLYYMNPVRAAFLPKGARKILFQKQLRFYSPVLSIIALGLLSGLMFDDPEDAKFLKIDGNKLAEWTKFNGFKDMTIDISGGSKEAWRTAILGGEKIAYDLFGNGSEASEKKRKAVNKELYQMFITSPRFFENKYQGERVGTFWRYGMHPGLSIIDSWIDGHDAVGKPYGAPQAARDLLLPLPARQIGENLTYNTPEKDQTWKDTAVRTIFSLAAEEVGGGVQSYRPVKKETSVNDKLRSGDISESEALDALQKEFDTGVITRRQYQTRKGDLGNDAFEKKAKNLDASSDKNFEQIETFLKELPSEQKDSVREVMLKKRTNKLKDDSDKARRDAQKLAELIEKYLK